MRFFLFLFGLMLAFFSQTISLHACDLCAVYNATHASRLGGKGWSVGLAEQFTHYGTIQEDGEEISNTLNQSMDSSITQIFASYDINSKFGLQFTIPVITRHFKRAQGHHGEVEQKSVTGIGDISLLARVQAYQLNTDHFTFNWHVNGGLKFPTGSASRLNEELSEHDHEDPSIVEKSIHGHDLALGSGSLDAIVGSNLYTRFYRMLLTADLQYFIRSRGDIDYRFANDLHWNVGLGAYLLLRESYSFAIQARVSGEHKGLDNLNGISAEDTGITSLAVGPEFVFTWQDKLHASLGVDIPVMIENTALQTVADFRMKSAFSWRF